MAAYRLNELAELATDLGLTSQVTDAGRLVVSIDDYALEFCNAADDTRVGFVGTPWHAHGTVIFMTGSDTFIECDEPCILQLLASGELLVVSSFQEGMLVDRWIKHRDESLDTKYIEAGEELRVRRIRCESI